MLFRIRFQYCITVSSHSAYLAWEEATKIISEKPGAIIQAVERADLAKPGLFKRLFTGR